MSTPHPGKTGEIFPHGMTGRDNGRFCQKKFCRGPSRNWRTAEGLFGAPVFSKADSHRWLRQERFVPGRLLAARIHHNGDRFTGNLRGPGRKQWKPGRRSTKLGLRRQGWPTPRRSQDIRPSWQRCRDSSDKPGTAKTPRSGFGDRGLACCPEKSKVRKRHIVVDTLGRDPGGPSLHPANLPRLRTGSGSGSGAVHSVLTGRGIIRPSAGALADSASGLDHNSAGFGETGPETWHPQRFWMAACTNLLVPCQKVKGLVVLPKAWTVERNVRDGLGSVYSCSGTAQKELRRNHRIERGR